MIFNQISNQTSSGIKAEIIYEDTLTFSQYTFRETRTLTPNVIYGPNYDIVKLEWEMNGTAKTSGVEGYSVSLVLHTNSSPSSNGITLVSASTTTPTSMNYQHSRLWSAFEIEFAEYRLDALNGSLKLSNVYSYNGSYGSSASFAMVIDGTLHIKLTGYTFT